MSIANIQGKAVLVVGGTRGIGRASTERLQSWEPKVGLTGRNADKVSEIATSLGETYGQPVSGHALDVADRAQIREGVEQFKAQRGKANVLVYDAGVSPVYASAEKIDEETWDSIVATNRRTPSSVINSARTSPGRTSNSASIATSTRPARASGSPTCRAFDRRLSRRVSLY